jgi:hypothetical protein
MNKKDYLEVLAKLESSYEGREQEISTCIVALMQAMKKVSPSFKAEDCIEGRLKRFIVDLKQGVRGSEKCQPSYVINMLLNVSRMAEYGGEDVLEIVLGAYDAQKRGKKNNLKDIGKSCGKKLPGKPLMLAL